MTQKLTHSKAESASELSYKPFQRRNISSRALSFLAALFAAIAAVSYTHLTLPTNREV